MTRKERQADYTPVIKVSGIKPPQAVGDSVQPAPKSLPLLVKCLKQAGMPSHRFDVSRYENRRLIQNSAFMLQRLGVDLGYEFDMTVVGVFSKQLSKELWEATRK